MEKILPKRTLIRMLKPSALFCLLAATLAGCGGGGSTSTTPSSGTANFSKYVAIGDYVTGGYADEGVYRASQLVAYPNLLSQQFALAGGGSFAQPSYSTAQKDGTGYLKQRSSPTAFLKTELFSTGSTGFVTGIVGSNGSLPLYAKHVGVNNNLGVPNMKVADILTTGYGLSNPTAFNSHFERLLGASNASDSYRSYVASESTGTTFFSMWLGTADVLGYASAGGTGAAMTDVTTFTTNLQALINDVTAIAPKGFLVNIPKYTDFAPLFRYNTIASLLNASGTMSTTIWIETSSGTRAATNADLFPLSRQARYVSIGSSSFGAGQPFPFGLHPNNPLVDADVLDSSEVAEVVTRTNDLNAVIAAQAAAKGIPLIDLNVAGGVIDKANTTGFSGAPYNSTNYTTTFITGGLFSLDGFTFTPAGNAIFANEIIKVINAQYGATLPLLDLSNY